jgi:hypothetical protein
VDIDQNNNKMSTENIYGPGKDDYGRNPSPFPINIMEVKTPSKPIHAKPSYYAIMFEPLKAIALKYGYNLVLHGSLNRDMDLIAIPWNQELGSVEGMINEFCEYVGGKIHPMEKPNAPHGRKWYIIDIYRGGYEQSRGISEMVYHEDPQTYIDISVTPII